jgi:hypothetical protein
MRRVWSPLFLAFLSTIASCGRTNFELTDSSTSGWQDLLSPARMRLDLNRYQPAGPVNDVVLLVVLDQLRFDPTLSRTDLADLHFINDGTTLRYEIEQLSPIPLVWLHVPVINNLPIWLYFGGDSPSQQPATPVWADSYVGVWHLDNTSDSSQRGNLGSITNAQFNAGRIGGALSVTGNGYMAIPHNPGKTTWSGGRVTVTGWVNLRTLKTFVTIIGRQYNGEYTDDFAIDVGMDGAHAVDFTTDAGINKLTKGAFVGQNRWVHLGVSFDQNNISLYQDGVLTQTNSLVGAVGQSLNPIHFGADSNTPPSSPEDEYVDGLIDEVRIDSVARSSDWIAADHAAQSDSWISYGPIERRP